MSSNRTEWTPLQSDRGRKEFKCTYTAEEIDAKMDDVKVRHRSEYALDEWKKDNYAERFPALREKNVAWLETLDALTNKRKHKDAVTDMSPIQPYLDGSLPITPHDFTKKERGLFDINSPATTPQILNIIRSVDRVHESELSVEDFKKKYETPSLPIMITGLTEKWPSHNWTASSILETKYATRRFRVGDDDNGRAIRIPYDFYLQYMFTNKDDSPLYLFEDAFDDDEVSRDMLKEYEVPKYFKEDMFPLLPHDRRPPFRWVLVGSERSGTRMHLDPLSTSAWNVVVSGHKRWVLMSPSLSKELALGRNVWTPQEREAGISPQAVYWFEEVLPRIREFVSRSGKEDEYRLMEFIQYPGEVVFVPSGWWHAVINLTDSVSFTQNWVSTYNFPLVWKDMKERRKHLARRLLQRLRHVFPAVAAVAEAADSREGYTFNSKIKRRKSKPTPSFQSPEEVEKLRSKKAAILAVLKDVNAGKFTSTDTNVISSEIDTVTIDTPHLQPVFEAMMSGESDSSSDSDSDSDDSESGSGSDSFETDTEN